MLVSLIIQHDGGGDDDDEKASNIEPKYRRIRLLLTLI